MHYSYNAEQHSQVVSRRSLISAQRSAMLTAVFVVFLSPSGKHWNSVSDRLSLLHSMSFPINCSLITPPFVAVLVRVPDGIIK
jgi:hypothetical protein